MSWPAELCTVRASHYEHGKFCCVARSFSRNSILSVATWTMIWIEQTFVNTIQYITEQYVSVEQWFWMHNVQQWRVQWEITQTTIPTLDYHTIWININLLRVKLQCKFLCAKTVPICLSDKAGSRMLDQTRQGFNVVSRELVLLYCVSQSMSILMLLRMPGCLAALPLWWHDALHHPVLCQGIYLIGTNVNGWWTRFWTQHTRIPSKAVMQHWRASSQVRQQKNAY